LVKKRGACELAIIKRERHKGGKRGEQPWRSEKKRDEEPNLQTETNPLHLIKKKGKNGLSLRCVYSAKGGEKKNLPAAYWREKRVRTFPFRRGGEKVDVKTWEEGHLKEWLKARGENV